MNADGNQIKIRLFHMYCFFTFIQQTVIKSKIKPFHIHSTEECFLINNVIMQNATNADGNQIKIRALCRW